MTQRIQIAKSDNVNATARPDGLWELEEMPLSMQWRVGDVVDLRNGVFPPKLVERAFRYKTLLRYCAPYAATEAKLKAALSAFVTAPVAQGLLVVASMASPDAILAVARGAGVDVAEVDRDG